VKVLEELGIECQVGDATKIRAAEPRKQKHDRRDAELILKLLVEKRFPAIWMPNKELLDLRGLLLHRHQWVRLRTQIQNALQAIALANGLRRGPSLWSYDGQAKIAFLPLLPHTSLRRSALQALYRNKDEKTEKLTVQLPDQPEHRPGAQLLTRLPFLEGKPETFNFLGFTHICGQAWKNGKFLVLRKSIRKRLLAKLKQVKEELRMRMHQPLADVGKWLRSVVQGYFNYHAVPGNSASLLRFRREVSKRWLRVLKRRSQKSRISWKHLTVFAAQWLPRPKILHPYPYMRFDANYLR